MNIAIGRMCGGCFGTFSAAEANSFIYCARERVVRHERVMKMQEF